MTEEAIKSINCFLAREEPIGRLQKVVFAAREACRRESKDSKAVMSALPSALGAKCNICGLELTGGELLALAGVTSANEESTMLKRLREGKCARETCASSFYSLSFYNIPQINWTYVFATYQSQENPEVKSPPPELKPASAQFTQLRIPMLQLARVGAVVGICVLTWVCWRFHTGGNIPILRQPEHFRVTPGTENHPSQYAHK